MVWASLGNWPFGRRADSQDGTWSDVTAPAWEPALRFSSANGEWPVAVYQRTTLPVRAAAPDYADGERAGATACSRTEQGIVPSLQESLALLSGDFVLCSGATRSHFDASSLQMQREDGSVIRQTTFQRDTSARTLKAQRLSVTSSPG